MLVTTADDQNSIGSTGKVEIVNLATSEKEILIESAFNARYASSGHIVFSRDAAIWAVPLILRLCKSREIVPVVQGVETDQRRGAAIYSFSDQGRLVFLRGLKLVAGQEGVLSQELAETALK